MISGEYTVRRPVSPQDRCGLIDLQATIGRTVGTHIGAPLEIFSTTGLRANLLGSKIIKKAIMHSQKLQALPESYLTAILKDELPATAEQPLHDVAIKRLKFVGRGALQLVGLEVYSPDMNREQDGLLNSLHEISDLRTAHLRTPIIPIGIIGTEHAADVERALEPSLQREISLEPMKFGARPPAFRRAS